MAPRSTLNRPDFRWPIRFSRGIPFLKKTKFILILHLWKKSQRRHPFSALMEPIREAIVWDSSMRFSLRTFMRMMTRIMEMVFANGLPTTGKIRSLESSFHNRGLDE